MREALGSIPSVSIVKLETAPRKDDASLRYRSLAHDRVHISGSRHLTSTSRKTEMFACPRASGTVVAMDMLAADPKRGFARPLGAFFQIEDMNFHLG